MEKQTKTLFAFPSKMMNIYNAVTDTLEELELEEYISYDIHEINENSLYHVTFQERENGNRRVVISVEYSTGIGDLMDDDAWEGEVDVQIVRREGMGQTTSQLILELLAITIDPDYYDSDSEEEESDDETLPRTPPPRASRPFVPRLQLAPQVYF